MIEQMCVESLLCCCFTGNHRSPLAVLIVFYHSHYWPFLELACFKKSRWARPTRPTRRKEGEGHDGPGRRKRPYMINQTQRGKGSRWARTTQASPPPVSTAPVPTRPGPLSPIGGGIRVGSATCFWSENWVPFEKRQTVFQAVSTGERELGEASGLVSVLLAVSQLYAEREFLNESFLLANDYLWRPSSV